MEDSREVRLKEFARKVRRRGCFWFAQSPNDVMALSSDDGLDGLAIWSTKKEVLAALSRADIAKGYEPSARSLDTWMSEVLPGLESQELLVAVNPVDECRNALFASPKLLTDLFDDGFVLQGSDLRRSAASIVGKRRRQHD